MKLNRWVYAFAGVVTLLLAGLVYAWSVLSMPLAAYFTELALPGMKNAAKNSAPDSRTWIFTFNFPAVIPPAMHPKQKNIMQMVKVKDI